MKKYVVMLGLLSAMSFVSVCHAADIVSWNYNRYGDAYSTQSCRRGASLVLERQLA
jgi:hypothetical protein